VFFLLCMRFDLLTEAQAARRLLQGNVGSRRLLAHHLLTNVFPDFADKKQPE
jgi:hypothetical protein